MMKRVPQEPPRPSGDTDFAADLRRAVKLHRAGRAADAEAVYRRLLEVDPRHAQTHALLGAALLHRGAQRQARVALRRAIKLDPGQPNHHFNLGEIYRADGEHGRAITCLRRAERLNPRLPNLQFALGSSLLAAGEVRAAREALARATRQDPGDAHAFNNLGNACCADGDLAAALVGYRRAIHLQPGVPEFYVNLANTLLDTGPADEAVECYWQGISSLPDSAELHYRLGLVLQRLQRFEEAIACHRKATALAPRMADAFRALGECLLRVERIEAAGDCFEQALGLDEGARGARLGLGVCLQRAGRFSAAIEQHKAVLRTAPGCGSAWYQLSLNGGWTASESELRELEHQVEAATADSEDQVPLNFALANCLDRRGDYARAFVHYRAANETKARRLGFDARGHDRYVESLIDYFDRERLAVRCRRRHALRPLFIVGMPRSGTTLVEQILDAHPAVAARGERRDLPELVKGLAAGATGYPHCLDALDDQALGERAQLYLAAGAVPAGTTHLTDKLPGNYLRLGLIAKLFPEAKVIHLRRNPRDTCWSCYTQDFEQGLGFSYRLEDLAAVYLAYGRLMAHWRDQLPLPMLEIDYESLIEHPARQTRLLLEFCALPWEPACLHPERSTRPVNTASLWQVRQPINASSVGRWRHYAPWLGALGSLDPL